MSVKKSLAAPGHSTRGDEHEASVKTCMTPSTILKAASQGPSGAHVKGSGITCEGGKGDVWYDIETVLI